MKTKLSISILAFFLFLPVLISASSIESYQICGGDDEAMILCVGDVENTYYGIPEILEGGPRDPDAQDIIVIGDDDDLGEADVYSIEVLTNKICSSGGKIEFVPKDIDQKITLIERASLRINDIVDYNQSFLDVRKREYYYEVGNLHGESVDINLRVYQNGKSVGTNKVIEVRDCFNLKDYVIVKLDKVDRFFINLKSSLIRAWEYCLTYRWICIIILIIIAMCIIYLNSKKKNS